MLGERKKTAALFFCAAVLAASFQPGREVAHFPAALNEISGIAQSRANPDVFWVHNDSGDQPRIYAVNRSGKLIATYLLAGATAVDWEDMAISGSYLYLADIGDNNARRQSIRVYRVSEPKVEANQSPINETLTGVSAFDFVYEDGPRDAEGFMVDPLTNAFYIVSKRELDGNRLYFSESPVEGQLNRLTRVGGFSFTGTTGADISPDGLQVLIRRYSTSKQAAEVAASYWRRPDTSMSLTDLLAKPAESVALAVEPQGEAITFSSDNHGFYTISEGAGAPLLHYPEVP